MLKKCLAMIVACFVYSGSICFASPLANFSKGAVAVDLEWSAHASQGTNTTNNFGITTAVGDRWAINYRQTNYDPKDESLAFHAKNKEVNLIYKIHDNLQLYSGYSRTSATNETTGLELPDKNVVQIGAIVTKKLSERTTLYTILGGGKNVTNIEFGLSYQLQPGVELTSTYRHFSAEKAGPAENKLNLRGFNLGMTWKI